MGDTTRSAPSPDPRQPEIAATEAATQVFLDHRELLFSIVYNMLGTVADTEDVLQETWLSWATRSADFDAEPVENPRAYLVRIAVNQTLARRTALARSRESYVGPWLPEPLIAPLPDEPAAGDGAAVVDRTESVSMAMLVVLETLTPAERAVFVLHEVFGYPHAEIADILGRSPAAVRQLAHRAREHVSARRPRYRADPRQRREVTERFIAATFGENLDELLKVLAPEVTLWSDSGGKISGVGPRPVHGRDRVMRLLASGAARFRESADVQYRLVNGDPAAVFFLGDGRMSVLLLELTPDGKQVSNIYAIANPDKLSRVD